jgi:hypothetical protein
MKSKNRAVKKQEMKADKRKRKKGKYLTVEEQINCFAEIIVNNVLKIYGILRHTDIENLNTPKDLVKLAVKK